MTKRDETLDEEVARLREGMKVGKAMLDGFIGFDPDPVTFRLRLPMPPSTNALYRNAYGRGRVKTKRYEAWLRQADMSFLLQKRGITPVHGPYHLHIWRPSDGIDTDNLKAVPDVLVRWHLVDADSPKFCRSVHIEVVDGLSELELEVRSA